jgi:hypothetical protein
VHLRNFILLSPLQSKRPEGSFWMQYFARLQPEITLHESETKLTASTVEKLSPFL